MSFPKNLMPQQDYIVRRVESPPYKIDHQVLKPFDERKNVFGRMLTDRKAVFYGKSMYENTTRVIGKRHPASSLIEFVRALSSWTVYDYFTGAFSWKKLTKSRSIMGKPEMEKYAVTEPVVMSKLIKETAKIYGASLVGICRLERRWIYSHNIDGKPIGVPQECKYAIVTGIEMDAAAIKASPAFAASTATGIAYSRMAFCVACLAEFIRNLGYVAIPMGNDTALSIPLAIDAGLGELGRSGLLITPEHGSCVRLCKVFTDLPLEPDKPIEFGVRDFCKRCSECSLACEANAIQSEREPSFGTVCCSNNPGILRWPVNHDKCYSFWIENGNDCSSCIAACPLSSHTKTRGGRPSRIKK